MPFRSLAALALLLLAACAADPPPVDTAPGVAPPASPAGLAPAERAAWLGTSDLVYTSDYFSFAGRDAEGEVAFALDNNRGRDRGDFQAEHWVALHDEKTGWIDVAGTGGYDNPGRELVGIPNSPFFRFRGDPRSGIAIESAANGLVLEVGRMVERVREVDAETWYVLGSAPAVLRWRGRAVSGRVIWEDLIRKNWNLMTRPSLTAFGAFNAFYLATPEGGDLYIRSSAAMRPGAPSPVMGFSAGEGQSRTLEDLAVEEVSHSPGWGFYRWPTAWRARWIGPAGPAVLTLRLDDRRGMFNWVLGAYSLATVSGTLEEGGRTVPVFGLGELIR